MNLQIPRKQNLTGQSSQVDAAHLERALLENFLAIERWANQQSVSVCVAQTTSHTVGVTGSQTLTGPWTVLWDQYQLADTANNRIRVPEAGIYTGFITGFVSNFAPLNPALAGTLGWFALGISGGSSFMQPFSFQAIDNGVISLTTSSIAGSGPGEVLASFPFSATTAGYITAYVNSDSTQLDETVSAFGFVRLGNIPSKVQ